MNGIRALPNTVQLASMWTIAGAVISNRFDAKITPRDELSGLYWINKKAWECGEIPGANQWSNIMAENRKKNHNINEQNVAGAGGFEPPDAGTRILCLTA